MSNQAGIIMGAAKIVPPAVARATPRFLRILKNLGVGFLYLSKIFIAI